MKKIAKWTGIVLTGLFLVLVSFVGFGAFWGLNKWGELDIDEIIFQLQSPLEGTESGILYDYFLKGLVPVVLLAVIYITVQVILAGRKKGKGCLWFTAGCFVLSLAACAGIRQYVWDRLNVAEWLAGQSGTSTFIEDHYVDPGKVKLTFPEKKRNLIYIYLESMEVTFADEAAGGIFSENIIPELTELALAHEDFSGDEKVLDGGASYPGTTFTTGGIFAQSTGLPLRISIGGGNMDTQDSFFPAITALGDLLREQGYRQIFMCGSDATFGGRRLFFEDHGNFEIRDYPYAIEQGLIPADYKVFWGYEDEKLFAFAKETLQELAQGEEPFNLTMLTVDTHFPDGYVCDLCDDEFGDNQYANVVACSNRQTAAFVSWIMEQDFFEDTTIVLCGDHPTMSSTFCADVDPDYRRTTYTVYINAAAEPQNGPEKRLYSTFDDFPTTLAALGVGIEGDRLALGTNLFSAEQTLSEQYGYKELALELVPRSAFLDSLEKTEALTEKLVARWRGDMKDMLTVESYDAGSGKLKVRLEENYSASGPLVDSYVLVCTETGTGKESRVVLEAAGDTKGLYTGEADISGWSGPEGDLRVEMNLNTGDTLEDLTGIHLSELTFLHDDLCGYLSCLAENEKFQDDTVLIAVKDEGTKHLTQEMVKAMEALGLSRAEEIAGQGRISYLAKVEQGAALEEAGYEELAVTGVLQDGETSFAVTSGGYDNGNIASIVIDGTDYAVNHSGLNIVVYDPEKHLLVDSVRFKVKAE